MCYKAPRHYPHCQLFVINSVLYIYILCSTETISGRHEGHPLLELPNVFLGAGWEAKF